MPSAAVHCPERIRNGVRDRETDMLCQFEGFKPEREIYIWRERGLTDYAKMKRIIEKRIDNLANEYDMIKRNIIFSMQLYLFDENVYLGY